MREQMRQDRWRQPWRETICSHSLPSGRRKVSMVISREQSSRARARLRSPVCHSAAAKAWLMRISRSMSQLRPLGRRKCSCTWCPRSSCSHQPKFAVSRTCEIQCPLRLSHPRCAESLNYSARNGGSDVLMSDITLRSAAGPNGSFRKTGAIFRSHPKVHGIQEETE